VKNDQKIPFWRYSRGKRLLTITLSITLLGSLLSLLPTAANAVDACTPDVIEGGGYVTLKFVDTGTCTFTTPVGTTVMQGLIVGGGGGGGTDMGGGGGGGGYLDFETLTVTSQSLTITVGDGGAGAAADSNAAGLNGGNSIISGTGISLTSLGGAGGGSLTFYNSAPARSGGGSGGGAPGGDFNFVDLSSQGSQTSQSQTPSLSTIGGNQLGNDGSPKFGNSWTPGGGGGAGTAGSTNPGDGGDGHPNSILGVTHYWAGGGGGAGHDGLAGNGGNGGGGAGGGWNGSSTAIGGAGLNSGSVSPDGNYGGSGGANTGGGGGGSSWSEWNSLARVYNGGDGGSGIVVLKYLATSAGSASRVKINRAAGGTERRVAFATQPQIGFRDANFNTVTSSSPLVTATVSDGGTLVGTTTASATSGVATFSNLGIDGTIGASYTITYTAPGFTPAKQRVTLTGTNCDGSNFVCQPGDTTPNGGVIFYAPSEPFSCGADMASLCTYLEAAPKDWKGGGVDDPAHYFKAAGIYINGVSQDNLLVDGITYDASPDMSSTQIGLGLKNSNVLSALDTSTGNAAVASRMYMGGGKSDWYLPTLAELQLLCQFSHGQTPAVGNFCDYNQPLNKKVPNSFTLLRTAYQSSSQSYTNWHQNFVYNAYGPGEQNTWGYAPDPFATRPIRAFAATVTPAKVAVTRAPTGAERRTAFTTQPQVTIQSSSGVRDISATDTVTATVSAGGTLVGVTSARAVLGLATFANLGIDGAIGTTYTITFTVAGLTVATTNVTPAGTSCNGSSFTCQVGDTGPGGGTIYYYSSAGFDCGPTQSGTCNYLEVAPNTWNGGSSDPQVAMLAVRNDSLSIPDVAQELTFNHTPAGVGLGYKNSRAFKAFINSNSSVGAGLVGTYRGGGKADWYVPSSAEIGLLCQWALGGTQDATAGCSGSAILRGGFTSGPYWTSSQWSNGAGNFGGYIQYFSDGSTNADQWGDTAINLRPVRAFGAQPLVISVAALEGVTAPVRGASPTTTIGSGNGYTGTISWSDSPSTFQPQTIYTATISLTPESGFTLTGVSANFFTVAGATTVSNSPNLGVVTAVFPDTGVDPVNPDAPTGVTASLSNSTTAIISYTAPISNGGAVITSYTATSSPDSISETLSGSGSGTITITGLTPGRVYRFDVVATNIVGNSPITTSNYVGISYDGTNGSILCGSSGYFTIVNNVVVGSSEDCSGSVEIPEGVTSIGEEVFTWNAGITSVVFPDSLVSIGAYAFYENHGLTEIVIPDNVEFIGTEAFYRLENLTSLRIGSGVTSIEENTFRNAYSLSSLILGANIISIGNNAFRNASSLTSLVIPNSVESIGNGAFSGLQAMTSLQLGNNLTSIGDWAFQGASSLVSLTIPDTVTSLGQQAFNFYDGSSLTSLRIGSGITEIAPGTFEFASSLSSLRIPENVTYIGDEAFFGAWNLTSLRIPRNITFIGGGAFFTDDGLQSFYYCGQLHPEADFLGSGLEVLPFSCPASAVPDAPTSVTAILTTFTTASISFTAPNFDGGEAITEYTLTSTPTGISQTISQAGSGIFHVTGLIAGTRYSFTVRATNSIGDSLESTASNEIPLTNVSSSRSISIPSPKQQSSISEISTSTAKSGVATLVVITGKFVEDLANITINGTPIKAGEWKQNLSSVSFTMPSLTAGHYVIQLYNGSVPVLKALNFMVEKSELPMPTPTKTARPVRTPRPVPSVSPKPTASTPAKESIKTKLITIKCVKGKTIKTVKGTNPKCPSGYAKK